MVKLINLVTTKLVYQIEDLLSLHVFLFVSCLPLLLIQIESFVLFSPSWLLHPYLVFLILHGWLLISVWISLFHLFSYIFLFIDQFLMNISLFDINAKDVASSTCFDVNFASLVFLPLSPCLWLIWSLCTCYHPLHHAYNITLINSFWCRATPFVDLNCLD